MELPDGDFLDVDWVGRRRPDRDRAPRIARFDRIPLRAGAVESRSKRAAGAVRSCIFAAARARPTGCPDPTTRVRPTDVDWFARELRRREPETPLAGVAYSLGGNVLLKWLGESGTDNPVEGGCRRLDSVRARSGRRFHGIWFRTRLSVVSGAQPQKSHAHEDGQRFVRAFSCQSGPRQTPQLPRIRRFGDRADARLPERSRLLRTLQQPSIRRTASKRPPSSSTPRTIHSCIRESSRRPEERSANVTFEISPKRRPRGLRLRTLAGGRRGIGSRIEFPEFLQAHIEEFGPRMGSGDEASELL